MAAAEQHWPALHRPPPVRPLLTAARRVLARPAPAAPACAALDRTAHEQAFRSLLHDTSASFAEIAAMNAIAITDQMVVWNVRLQRVDVFFEYRDVAGVAPSSLQPYTPLLLTILASHLGLGPHATFMVHESLRG
jgi:hypothetical protein